VRTPMAALEERWRPLGFVRVHRSYLVSAAHISELRVEPGGGHAVRVGELVLPVSRRHSRELKDRLLRREGPR
jgi:DNA-binding LytR/AlgR family response regulator